MLEVGWGSGAEKVLNEAKAVASYAGELASFSNPSSKPWRHMMEGNELEVSRPSFIAMSHPVGPGGPYDSMFRDFRALLVRQALCGQWSAHVFYQQDGCLVLGQPHRWCSCVVPSLSSHFPS